MVSSFSFIDSLIYVDLDNGFFVGKCKAGDLISRSHPQRLYSCESSRDRIIGEREKSSPVPGSLVWEVDEIERL